MFLLIQSKYDNQKPLIFNEKGPVSGAVERDPFFSIIANTLTYRPCIKRGDLCGYKKKKNGVLYSACKYLSEIHDSIGRRIPFIFVLRDDDHAEEIQRLMQFTSDEYKLSDEELTLIKETLTDTQHKNGILFILIEWVKKILACWRRK